MNKQNLNILNHFANTHSIAIGGNIEVTIGGGCTNYKPQGIVDGMKLEDCNYLSDSINGATQLLFYLEREGYKIVKRRK